VNQAIVSRVNPWLLVVIVAVLLVAVAVLLAPAVLHAMNVVLPQSGACAGTPSGCH